MNRRMVCRTVGKIILLEGVLLVLPLITSLIYKETKTALSFLLTMAVAAIVGGVMVLIASPHNRVIYAKEGFAITSFAWVFLAAIGALPFVISGFVPSFIDAFFETVSGFTTTGASVLTDVEALSHGLLFWRSFTHWVGGMGVLVFLAAFVSRLSDRTIHLFRAEMPGHAVGKLLPKAKDTARILYLIYLAMTAAEVILLLFSGMNLFSALIHTFGTAGTGGFGIYSDGCASLSAAQQWIIAVFMLLFGVNFNLYYLILIRRFRAVFRSEELWAYLGFAFLSTAIIFLNLKGSFDSVGETLRHSFFQVSSIITTTGFSTVDFNLWPTLSKTILLILMFTGAMSGSTAGGFKISRVVLLFKNVQTEFRHLLHPRSVSVVHFEGKKIDGEVRKGVNVYLAVYCFCFFTLFLALGFDKFDLVTNFSAAAACFNNIGPALGAAGPMASYAAYSDVSKMILSFAMLLGRLEIWPIILSFFPRTWRGWRA